MITATSPYLNRPRRTLEQARADAARIRGVAKLSQAHKPTAGLSLAVHMANATPCVVRGAGAAAHAIAWTAAVLFLAACIGLGIGFLTDIINW